MLSQSRKSKVSYYNNIDKNENFQMSVELINMHYSSQDVVLTTHWEYLEAPYSDHEIETPRWLDIISYDHSHRPAAKTSVFTYSSLSVQSDFYGRRADVDNHLHDNVVLQKVVKNEEILYSANPAFYADQGADDNMRISHISSCFKFRHVASINRFALTARNHTVKYASMVNEDESLEPIMSISLAYTVKEAVSTGGSGNSEYEPAFIIIILVTLVLIASAKYVNRSSERRSRTVHLEGIGDLLTVFVFNAHLPSVVILGYHKVFEQEHSTLLRSVLDISPVASYIKH